MSEDRNCISYWFPKLQASGVPVPKTWITRTDINLKAFLYELDDKKDAQLPHGFDAFLLQLKVNALLAGSPCFLRTGMTSGKHEWNQTCFVQDPEKIGHHILKLVEFSILADFIGLATDVWAVREFLPLQVAFHAFDGMPVAREFRLFVRDGVLTCAHEYWPPDSITSPSCKDWHQKLNRISVFDDDAVAEAVTIVKKIGPHFDGNWSVDICPDVNGRWYVTDMAVAEQSFHWPSCPNAPKGVDNVS